MRMLTTITLLALALGVGAAPAQAEDEKTTGWFLTSEFSGIWTSGNAQSVSFGVKAELVRKMERSKLKFLAGTSQTHTTAVTRSAVGDTSDYTLREDSASEKTAELTTARARYDYDVSTKFFVFGGVDMLRNPFAGIDSRFVFFTGSGNIWIKSDETNFRTDVAMTYTVEDEVVANPIVDTNFPGIRLGAEFDHKISPNAGFASVVFADFNLNNSDDIRVEWLGLLPVTISKTFFLAPSLNLMWRNQPALGTVPLFDAEDMKIGSVKEPLDKLDSIFSISLIAKF